MTSDSSDIIVKKLTTYTPEDAAGIGALMPALNPKYAAEPVGETWLRTVIDSPHHDQVVAMLDGKIVGIATLNILMEPTAGYIGYLESFVVDPTVQGHGIGSKIWDFITEWCIEKGVRLEFTSNPTREAAHRFYTKHGATVRNTAVFRYEPTQN